MKTRLLALIIILLLDFNNVFSEESNTNLNIKLTTAFVPSHEEVKAKIFTPFINYEKHFGNNFSINFGFGSSILILNREGFGDYNSIDISNLMSGVGYSFNTEDISLKNDVNFTIGIPTAFYKSSNIDNKRLTEFDYTSIISAEGWSNPYPWLINTCPFIISYKGNLELSKYAFIDYLISPAFLLSINDRPSGLGLQNMMKFGIMASDFIASVGFNNYYSTINLENNDQSQSSILLGASYRNKSFLYDMSFGLNLDAPNGIFYNQPKTKWGISLALKYFIE